MGGSSSELLNLVKLQSFDLKMTIAKKRCPIGLSERKRKWLAGNIWI